MNKIFFNKSLPKWFGFRNKSSQVNSFAGSKRGEFFQVKPEITNQYLEDPFMIEQLKIDIPNEVVTLKIHFKSESSNKIKILILIIQLF